MTLCGYCGNNCCNGGSGDNCPDECASAYAFQATESAPAELQELERVEQAEWMAMTPEQRDAANNKQWASLFGPS